MLIFSPPSRSDIYKRLKKGYKRLSVMAQVHLEDKVLHEMGVDHVQIDLEEETERGGPYFTPMSQDQLSNFTERPLLDIDIDPDFTTGPWCYEDTQVVHHDYYLQLHHTGVCPYTFGVEAPNPWQSRPPRSGLYDQHLLGHLGAPLYEYPMSPKYQYSWVLEESLKTEGLPHRSCVSRAGIPDVTGLTRVEMQILTCTMIESMREQGNKEIMVVPVILVSIIGRYARVIQAHVSLDEERLKVRYSQLYDFDKCSQRLMDLFLRWTLSTPLSGPESQFRSNKSITTFNEDAGQSVADTQGQDNSPRASGAGIPMDALKITASDS